MQNTTEKVVSEDKEKADLWFSEFNVYFKSLTRINDAINIKTSFISL